MKVIRRCWRFFTRSKPRKYVVVTALMKSGAEVIWHEYSRDEVDAAKNIKSLMTARMSTGPIAWHDMSNTVIIDFNEIAAVDIRTAWK